VPLAEDPVCKEGARVKEPEGFGNLRCFDQKRRFGFDFLYPVSRYIDGLKNAQVKNRRGELVPNPLYTDAETGEPASRSPGSNLVFLAGIVGVPWQDIATPASLSDPQLLEYLPAKEIPWDRVLADPQTGPAKDSLMFETNEPRVMMPPHPLSGAPIAGPDAPSALANPINGHEHQVPNELQYACTFRLDTDFTTAGFQPRICDPSDRDCDCGPAGRDGKKPLCQDPNTGAYSSTQFFAKAYPGVRHLQVLKGLGDNAIVASICPKVLDVEARHPSFGYNPAVDSIVDVLAVSLRGTCLPRELDVAKDGSVPCKVIEHARLKSNETCSCAGAGRQDPDPSILPAVWGEMAKSGLCGRGPGQASCESQCICEITPAGGESDNDCSTVDSPLESCQCEQETNVVGYCYIDPGKGIGSAELVSDCRNSAPRVLRLVGTQADPTPKKASTVFVACAGGTVSR
jgi:hypothetical protein